MSKLRKIGSKGLVGLNGQKIESKEAKNLRYLEVQQVKKKYEELRQIYLEDFNFQIGILSDAEKMNEQKMAVKGVAFLGWTKEHSAALTVLRNLVKYLENNATCWDFKFVDTVIANLPKYEDEV